MESASSAKLDVHALNCIVLLAEKNKTKTKPVARIVRRCFQLYANDLSRKETQEDNIQDAKFDTLTEVLLKNSSSKRR
jgi:hypothetical protein